MTKPKTPQRISHSTAYNTPNLQLLREMHRLITKAWHKGCMYRDSTGARCDDYTPNGSCCIAGAYYTGLETLSSSARYRTTRFKDLLQCATTKNPELPLVHWNDLSTTKKRHVLAAILAATLQEKARVDQNRHP